LNKIRVVVVDDSAFMRLMLTRMLESEGDMTVVGTAKDGQEALDVIAAVRPDVVTLDVEMPRMDGLQCLVEVLNRYLLPVIMVSSVTTQGAPTTIKALEIGAVDFVAKPASFISFEMPALREELLQKVRVASAISPDRLARMIRERRRLAERAGAGGEYRWTGRFELVAIGCSTGGPAALNVVLPAFPAGVPVGILVAQHMPPGFTEFLAKNLALRCQVGVREARDGDVLEPGTALVAPAGRQTVVERRDGRLAVKVFDSREELLYRPCIDLTFRSVADACGSRAVGVLLTGMGEDGARGLLEMRRAGAVTVVESEETAVVHGMPRAAREMGAACREAPLGEIAHEVLAVI